MIGPSSCAYLAAAGAQNVLRLQSACPNPAYRRHCRFGSQYFVNIVDCKVVIVLPRITPSILSFLTCSDTNGFKVTNEPGELSKRWAETLIAIAVTGSFFGLFPCFFSGSISAKKTTFCPRSDICHQHVVRKMVGQAAECFDRRKTGEVLN